MGKMKRKKTGRENGINEPEVNNGTESHKLICPGESSNRRVIFLCLLLQVNKTSK